MSVAGVDLDVDADAEDVDLLDNGVGVSPARTAVPSSVRAHAVTTSPANTTARPTRITGSVWRIPVGLLSVLGEGRRQLALEVDVGRPRDINDGFRDSPPGERERRTVSPGNRLPEVTADIHAPAR